MSKGIKLIIEKFKNGFQNIDWSSQELVSLDYWTGSDSGADDIWQLITKTSKNLGLDHSMLNENIIGEDGYEFLMNIFYNELYKHIIKQAQVKINQNQKELNKYMENNKA